VTKLSLLSDTDLTDTVLELEKGGYVNRLLENISDTDQKTFSGLIDKIDKIRRRQQSLTRIEDLLAYGLFDWAITDEDARSVLITLRGLTPDQRKIIIYRMADDVYFDRLMDNISSKDKVTYAALIAEIQRTRTEYENNLANTNPVTAPQKAKVEEYLTPNIIRDPITLLPAAFVNLVAGKTYKEDIEAKLDTARAWMFAQSTALLGSTKLPMSRFEEIGEEAKRQTDAVFGQYKKGPAFVAGANLLDRSLQPADAEDLVRYLIHNQAEVLPVHPLHSAIPSRPTETAIINGIITTYAAAHKAELDVIDKAWPGTAGGGVVNIQPFKGATPKETREVFWRTFQTMIHEYLHTITNSGYSTKAHTLGGAKESILIEGATSLFTDEVWKVIFPQEIRANEDLRRNVEGGIEPFDATVIPPISHYDQIVEARKIRDEVGEQNMRAAYFLGRSDLIGI